MERVINQYSNMLFKICVIYLENESDAQDVIQETFCKYWRLNKYFVDEEHEKAWLIRVAVNHCKDIKRKQKTHSTVSFEELLNCSEYGKAQENMEFKETLGEVFGEIMKLPEKIRLVFVLFYVEGYHIDEIAKILTVSENAVKKRLQRGRMLLQKRLKGGKHL